MATGRIGTGEKTEARKGEGVESSSFSWSYRRRIEYRRKSPLNTIEWADILTDDLLIGCLAIGVIPSPGYV
ncbi:hypothetical protein GCM10027190_63010 [Spirosoma areae]